jgi:uncharacterized protein (DUF58 family)
MRRVAVRPLRRGLHKLPRLRATTLFPFHLVRITTSWAIEQEMLILPFYRRLSSCNLAQVAHGLSRGDACAARSVGLTGEYIGSREYQPGMAVRRWDYPSWARLGQPVVREFSKPQEPSVAVVLDTFFPQGEQAPQEAIPELEAMLSLAAGITEAFIECGCRIAVLAVGTQVVRFANRYSSMDQQAILAHLAVAAPSPAAALPALVHQLACGQNTWDLAVVLCNRWDAARQELMHCVTRQGAVGKPILVHQDGQAWEEVRPVNVDNASVSQIEAGVVGI